MKSMAYIAGIAIKELLYEKVFYLLIVFVICALGLSVLLGQLTYAEQTKLTIDFMLAGMELSMVLFSVFVGISLFQKELTFGSISMVLSKPIPRTSFLLGKFFGQLIVQLIVIAGMGAITYFSCSRLPEPASLQAIVQASLLISFEVMTLSAITYFFAVNAGSLMTALATLALFFLGHFRSISALQMGKAESNPIWSLAKSMIPSLEIFNMKALASYGYSIPWASVQWAFIYALSATTFYLVLGAVCFSRKDIAT